MKQGYVWFPIQGGNFAVVSPSGEVKHEVRDKRAAITLTNLYNDAPADTVHLTRPEQIGYEGV